MRSAISYLPSAITAQREALRCRPFCHLSFVTCHASSRQMSAGRQDREPSRPRTGKMQMARTTHVALIQNPASGYGNRLARLAVRQRLAESGSLCREIVVGPGKTIASQTLELLRDGADLIAVAGGDGTVREAASALVGKQVPLLIIPVGTFNNLARSLGIPLDPIAASKLVHTGTLRHIDAGRANRRHYFFEAAGVGVDAQLFPLGEALKQGRLAAIFRAIQVTLIHHQTTIGLRLDRSIERAYQRSFRGRTPMPRRRRRFQTNRDQIRLRGSFLTIANGPYYGSNFNVMPGAKLDDGLLSVGVFRDFSKRELLNHFWSISRGRRQYHPKLETFECAWLEVSAHEPLQVHVDGRPIGTTPAQFEIVPKALPVITP
jgi:diacylglycerol kinase (ATP)